MFRIQGKERINFTAAELNELNTTYASFLKRGSMKIPMPKLYEYRGGFFGYISSAVELYRNGNHDNVRQQVHYRDFTRIGRNGAVSDPLVKTSRQVPYQRHGYSLRKTRGSRLHHLNFSRQVPTANLSIFRSNAAR